MKQHRLLFSFLLFFISLSIQAQTNYGAEIVSRQKFGEGLMVVRARIVPLSGTVSNIFFFNRSDQPWNGNVWYEYDWEIRGKYPKNGWSQIRVRSKQGGQLKDAPVNISTSVNLGKGLYNYILIRKGDKYVYDIRKNFKASTYDYTRSGSHGGNSASLVVGGPRVYKTGGGVADIPTSKQLDFSLGITAFDNNWAGKLPSGSYSEDLTIDYARFYRFSGNKLNANAQWQDEFNGNSVDQGKWQIANWVFSKTQFTANNIRFSNGRMIMRINRNGSSSGNLALSGAASQSSTAHGGSASRAIDNNTNGAWDKNSVTHTNKESKPWWQVRLAQTSDINQIKIYNRTNCCSNRLSSFKVEVLNNNGSKVFSRTFNSAPNPSLTINTGGVVGRTVRVQLNNTNPLSLAEVQVIGTTTNESRTNERPQSIAFSHLTAQKEIGRKVSLNWLVDQVQRPIRYEVEYKNAEGIFELLDIVPADESTDRDFYAYHFAHHSPVAGDNTYRVKIVFENNVVTYLNPTTITLDLADNTTIFPNPTQGKLFVDLSTYQDKEVQLLLTDPSGKAYLMQQLPKDHSPMIELDMSRWDNGFYILNIEAENSQTKSEKISLMRPY